MKKYQFSMQGVLNAKAAMEDAAKMELAKARAFLLAQEQELGKFNQLIDMALDSASRPSSRTPDYLMQYANYMRRLKNLKRQQEFKINDAKIKVEAAVSRLASAMVEVKKMKKADEHEFKRWNQEFLRDEQKNNDETGTTRAFRASASE